MLKIIDPTEWAIEDHLKLAGPIRLAGMPIALLAKTWKRDERELRTMIGDMITNGKLRTFAMPGTGPRWIRAYVCLPEQLP